MRRDSGEALSPSQSNLELSQARRQDHRGNYCSQGHGAVQTHVAASAVRPRRTSGQGPPGRAYALQRQAAGVPGVRAFAVREGRGPVTTASLIRHKDDDGTAPLLRGGDNEVVDKSSQKNGLRHFCCKPLILLVPRERNGIRLRQHAGIKRKSDQPGAASSNFVPADCTPMYHHHQAGSLWFRHQPQLTEHIIRPKTTGNVHARVRVVVNG